MGLVSAVQTAESHSPASMPSGSVILRDIHSLTGSPSTVNCFFLGFRDSIPARKPANNHPDRHIRIHLYSAGKDRENLTAPLDIFPDCFRHGFPGPPP